MNMLTSTILELGFLIALWVLVFIVIGAVSRDIFRKAAVSTSATAQDVDLAAPPVPAPPRNRGGSPQISQPNSASVAELLPPVQETRLPEQIPVQETPIPKYLEQTNGQYAGQRITLEHPITIGRSSECTIAVDDDYASSVHARIYPADHQEWFVEDLGSTNGTYINEHPVGQTQQVLVGDVVRVGKTTFELGR